MRVVAGFDAGRDEREGFAGFEDLAGFDAPEDFADFEDFDALVGFDALLAAGFDDFGAGGAPMEPFVVVDGRVGRAPVAREP